MSSIIAVQKSSPRGLQRDWGTVPPPDTTSNQETGFCVIF